MSIDVSRLSPWAQRQIAQKLLAREREKAAPEKENKYHAQREQRGELSFDSKKEARRYDELMLLLKTERISDLRLQPQFTLQEAYTTPAGDRIRAIRYQADFSYWQDGELVVEDVKSEITRKNKDYRMKVKMMQGRHGITVREV